MNQDEDHLRLLSIFHYVLGGLTALFSCIALLQIAMGMAILHGDFPGPGPSPPGGIPPFMGWMFIIIPLIAMAIGWTMAIAMVVAGSFIAKRRGYVFCLAVAGIECLMMPLGTALGVFTIIVLLRPTVKELFQYSP